MKLEKFELLEGTLNENENSLKSEVTASELGNSAEV